MLKNRIFKNQYQIKKVAALLSFIQGFHDILNLLIFYYCKNLLDIGPGKTSILKGIITIPFTFKPFIAVFTDKYRLKFRSIKPLTYLGTIVQSWILFSIMYFKIGYYMLTILMVIYYIFYAQLMLLIQSLIIILSKKQVILKEKNETGFNLTYYYGYRCLGAFIFLILSSFKSNDFDILNFFYILSFWNMINFLILIFYKNHPQDTILEEDEDEDKVIEENKIENEKWNNIEIYKQSNYYKLMILFTHKDLIRFLILIGFLNMTPLYSSVFNYFMSNVMNYDQSQLLIIYVSSYIFMWLGVYFFRKWYSRNVNMRYYYFFGHLILFIMGYSYSLIIFHIISKIGLNEYYFIILWNGLVQMVFEFNLLPILTICAEICPKNLESTSYAIFTSYSNFTFQLNYFLSSFIMYLMGVHKENVDKLFTLIIIKNFYYIIFIIWLWVIKFPNSKKILNDFESKIKNNKKLELVSVLNKNALNNKK